MILTEFGSDLINNEDNNRRSSYNFYWAVN